MSSLEKFINNDALCAWDPLTKMAVIHHQFESIHLFYDGNGRTGRIINIAKGKVHKRYEFGCKVVFVTTSASSWIVGAAAVH